MNNDLLSRSAEALFWLSRYIERAENLARILDVNESFSRDRAGARNWLSVVQINADSAAFFARYTAADPASVIAFYVTDAANPTSILSALRAARENARTLRPLISTEMWVQLNRFHARLAGLAAEELAPGRLAPLLSEIKEACQTHTGITEGTFFRDQGWYFCQLGHYLERADQTTRLLDVKYHVLLPRTEEVGSPVDASQWNALLRSAAGYHAYRRLHPRGIAPAQVAGFLLLNRRFPRSVYLCVREAELALADLSARYGLRNGRTAAEELDALRGILSAVTIEEVLIGGLHEFLDMVQLRLAATARALGEGFFGDRPA
ncbi:MAG: alpha-E domain-containing protein [Acetobacteraceae bacterium]